MAEKTEYNDRIIYLATAYRAELSQKENFTFDSSQKMIQSHPQSKEHFTQDSTFQDDDDTLEGIELPKKLDDIDITEWNKAFYKLRPPLNVSKRRQPHGAPKLTNKPCEEILEVVRSYKENLESENEYLQERESRKEANESITYLWYKEDVEVIDVLQGDEYLEEINSICESSETPIPRNLASFNY